jgi:hypothetical protein
MNKLAYFGLILIFLLSFNYTNASIVNITPYNNSNEEKIFQLRSKELYGYTENLGKIILNGTEYILSENPNVTLEVGSFYTIEYIPIEGYVFDHWEVEGGELNMSEEERINIFYVTCSEGKIIAFYRNETIEEGGLALGKSISLYIHELIEMHKENISEWILEHKILIKEKHEEKLKAIEEYQNETKQILLSIKNEIMELREKLKNKSIDEEEYNIRMRILNKTLELKLIRRNNKLGYILGNISKTFSIKLKEEVEELKNINFKFRDEMKKLKENIKKEIEKTKKKKGYNE